MRRKVLLAVAAVCGLGFVSGLITLVIILQDMPNLSGMQDYKPPVATKVFDRNGELIDRFFKERRTVVARDRMPDNLVNAFLAAEDAEFYQHGGFDTSAIVAAVIQEVGHKLFRMKRRGGSTITQQVAKTFLLSPRQTYTRKLRELYLARRIESVFTKDEILFLYLNQIYFGHGAYGVEEAAQTYFGKHVWELNLAECATLASIPKNPNRINPIYNPNRTLQRRAYVLGQMKARGLAPPDEVDAASASPLFRDRPPPEFLGRTPYYSEEVRRELMDTYGGDRVFQEGLVAYAAVDAHLDVLATRALERGLEEVDRRRGWRGPLLRLEPDVMKGLMAELRTHLQDRLPTDAATRAQMVWDLRSLTEKSAQNPAEAAGAIKLTYRDVGVVVAGVVDELSADGSSARVDLGTTRGQLPLKGMKWARPRQEGGSLGPAPRLVSDILQPGDVILVRVVGERAAAEGETGVPELALEQKPEVQGALVAVEPQTRRVLAMVGGYDFVESKFDRATQARRQPGSSFKPFIYAAAVESRNFTAATIILDAPKVFSDPHAGDWKPENSGGKFRGEIRLRECLTHSVNICSITLVEALLPKTVVEVAQKVGLGAKWPNNLTLALGTGEVTPLSLANAYATFAAGGVYAEPVLVEKVKTAAGEVLEQATVEPVEVFKPSTAFVMLSMMKSVVEAGTARALRDLGRPVAGKTGTTNDARDAWFAGCVPGLCAAVWVGMDSNQPLGSSEYGGRAAAPIFLEFFKAVLDGTPERDFEMPEGVVTAAIDPRSGLLAYDGQEDVLEEFFVEGTTPTEKAPNPAETGTGGRPLDWLEGGP